MGAISSPQPTLLLLAAFSRHADALAWALDRATTTLGPLALVSPNFTFTDTDYYTPTMGPELTKLFWTFEPLIDPARIAEIKLQTNAWEAEYAALGRHAEPRPLNLDPGYVGLGKLVLASTKDHAHRIYLGQGIYAEITLYYKDRRWQVRDWTFADYRRDDYHAFFNDCRAHLVERLNRLKKKSEGLGT